MHFLTSWTIGQTATLVAKQFGVEPRRRAGEARDPSNVGERIVFVGAFSSSPLARVQLEFAVKFESGGECHARFVQADLAPYVGAIGVLVHLVFLEKGESARPGESAAAAAP